MILNWKKIHNDIFFTICIHFLPALPFVHDLGIGNSTRVSRHRFSRRLEWGFCWITVLLDVFHVTSRHGDDNIFHLRKKVRHSIAMKIITCSLPLIVLRCCVSRFSSDQFSPLKMLYFSEQSEDLWQPIQLLGVLWRFLHPYCRVRSFSPFVHS